MTQSIKTHFINLSTALAKLKPTGQKGFEGLIAVALEAIIGTPFRLASSGYQRGVDGKAAFNEGVVFEAKLYTTDLQRADILSKIPDFVRHNDYADLVWVLGATCAVPTQLAEDLRTDGNKDGISVLVLDWMPSDYPRLAVTLAMGGEKVEAFLKDNLKSDEAIKKALAALLAIRNHEAFPLHEVAIRQKLDAAEVATDIAVKANAKWFVDVLSDKALARSELGQPIALKDAAVNVLSRDDLVSRLTSYLTDSAREEVVFVHGGEGCGKSWIIIQSWLSQTKKPILLFATPDDFLDVNSPQDIETRLLRKLIAQTGGVESEENIVRWRRRLKAWRDSGDLSSPRLMLVLDGVNQRPDQLWGKLIDHIANYVGSRGGRVVVSARTHYFQARIKRAMNCAYKDIVVPEWSEGERDEILKHEKVPLNRLNSSVAEFLKNPRILSIALDVFGSDVAAFEELSVERLLFEHIMAGIKGDFGEHPADFIDHLRAQASKLSKRVASQVRDDLYIFESDVPAVAEGRFYCSVPGELRKYELKNEGLILALGLSLIENLRKAERNDRNLDDTLREVLEPVGALDKTAEAVTAAIIVCAADDEEYSPTISKTLIKGYSELQNPPPDSFGALVSFARVRSLTFAEVTRDISLQGGQQPNFEWIQAALVKAAGSDAVWCLICDEVERWLRAYSLSPERRMLYSAQNEPNNKVEEERKKRQTEIGDKLEALTPAEKARQDRLVETKGNLDVLSRLTLVLLVDKDLKLFAEALSDWSFANAINSSFHTPTKDFLALIGLNRRDWQEMRSALLIACKDLAGDNVSKTGKWALLTVLRATGDPEDDRAATELYKELTKHRHLVSGLYNENEKIEPSDPNASAPVDLGDKVCRYDGLDVSDLRQHMGTTRQDHFFVDDRPVVARFALQSAVKKHREFANDVVERAGMSLRQGLLELREHVALITEDMARSLVAKWSVALRACDDQGLPEDEGIMLQYELLIAFPFLDALNQIELLLGTNEQHPLLLELINETKTPDRKTLDQLTEEVVSSDNTYKQHLLLEIVGATGAEISNKICGFACTAVSSSEMRLRVSAISLAARSGHLDLLKTIAESDWASDPSKDKHFENWYGSLALLKAAQAGLTDESAVLDRISPCLFGRAAVMLSGSAVREVAKRINASIFFAAGLSDELIAPEIEMEADEAASDEPTRFLITERDSISVNADDFFKRLSESNEEFRERQNGNYNAFIAFREDLTSEKAQIILDHITSEEFDAVVAADLTLADRWYDLFMGLSDNKLPALHNLILLLARAIVSTDPKKSAELIERISHSRPLVHFTFGKSGVDLESISAWTGPSVPELDAMRARRLDNAITDQALAVEVFSALQCGQEGVLEAYIDEKLDSSIPSEVARGIMVVGFCDKNSRNDQILNKYADTQGLPGRAYEAANAAYLCNVWARHWFKIMCETPEPVTFWQAKVLFTQCVDGRFLAWRDEFEQTGMAVNAFHTSLKNPLRRRYEKLVKEREKKLFGQEAPAPVFVQRFL